jgi:hypothetical protein
MLVFSVIISKCLKKNFFISKHSYDILSAGMLWKPKEARILKNFIDQPVVENSSSTS